MPRTLLAPRSPRQARPPRPATARAAGRLDRTYLGRSSPPKDLRVAAARGSTVVDEQGHELLDFFMGWCVGNLGWAQRDIKAALRAFRGPDYVSPHFQYAPWGELASLLARLAPGRLRRSFRAVGGTEAVEIALQAAMLATGRRRFLSLEGAYHGNSLAARSLGGKKDAGLPLRLPSQNLKPPLDGKALRRVEAALRRRDVAAVILEPIACNLGVVVPSQEFMEGLQEACRASGTLLIADEVACGLGRTGKLFACEHFRLEPDILCLAKAITGGHAPLGATLMTEEVAGEVAEDLDFYSTYGWHPLAVEAALANLRHLERHRDALLRNVEARGRQFQQRLEGMPFAQEVRAKGLAIGVDTRGVATARRIVQRCREDGLLLNHGDATLQLFPALTIDRATAERGLAILERAGRRM